MECFLLLRISESQSTLTIITIKTTTIMKYNEFNNKYNKRNYAGVCLECSIINLDGDVIFRGTIDEVDAYWDEHIELVWDENDTSLIKHSTDTINGQEVVTTNVGETGRYSDYLFNKLHFNVERN